ncbi:MAG: flavin reductase family protein [Candidatus Hydrothermarchaeota archaeon]|nr:MAG: flavin reductase family protein [Candidatus Hydrothermarchaeota archaeon]
MGVEFYKLFVRPTVVVTTISKRRIPNAAPFSFCSPISFSPPLIGIACSPKHDTWRNIKETKEFVINLAGKKLGEVIHILEKDFPYEVSEIEKAGLTEEESKKVLPPRIKEAYAWLECRLYDSVELGDHVWIAGEVLLAEAKPGFYRRVVEVEKAKPLCHIGGEYFAIVERITKFKRD